MKKYSAIYGNIIFPDDDSAIVQGTYLVEPVEGIDDDECCEMAEWNSSFFGGDWIIPELYHGTITYEVTT
jgi:hypothetical protein